MRNLTIRPRVVALGALVIVLAGCGHTPRKTTPEEQALLDSCTSKQSVRVNGVDLDYAIAGDASAPPLLLIMGLGGQRVAFDPGFIGALVERGFRVITFDNRDAGLSTKFHEAGPAELRALVIKRKLGMHPEVPYQLGDMADDAAGLIDALGLEQAHVVGMSMGGMIAQEVALRHPRQVLSLTSIMSTTNDPSLPGAKQEALDALMAPRAKPGNREEAIEQGVTIWQVLGGSLRQEKEVLRERVIRSIDRCRYSEGAGRQLAAIISADSRRERLKTLNVPALVIHGREDPLVPFPAGEDTARHIPGAKFLPMDGMGHDIPVQYWGVIADEIATVARKAKPQPQ